VRQGQLTGGRRMARVIVVDDEKGLRVTMAQFLEKEGHQCIAVEDARSALVEIATGAFDVMVSDIVMPGMDGMELLQAVREASPRIQVILITGEPTLETAAEAVRCGAFDYIAKPAARARLCSSVAAAARMKRLEDENVEYREKLENLVESRTKSLKESLDRLRTTLENTAQALSAAMEMRDPYTAGHQRRVTRLACDIHDRMSLSLEAREGLRVAGLLHDLGKLAVPAEILSKPTRLSSNEFALIKAHPVGAWDILRGMDFPWPVADIVRQHHERLDGSGYPDGLSGDAILMEARILGVADVVEAMSSHRPYRPALGLPAALDEITRNRGRLYDPAVVDACVAACSREGFTLDGPS